jgi:hypothetical protein
MATGASNDKAYPGVESHDWRGGPLLHRSPQELRRWCEVPDLGLVQTNPVSLALVRAA